MPQYHKEDPETIQTLFNSIARSYDRTNAVLSFRLHHGWNAALVNQVISGQKPKAMLDLCCGTGEIAFKALRSSARPEDLYLLDFSEEMLKCAKAKAANLPPCGSELHYIQGDAQAIPLRNASIDCATIAYGIRNVKNPFRCIEEVFRVLSPGGSFGILELTRPQNRVMRFGHHIYLRTLLPLLGWCFSANQEAYEYLCSSIHTFVEPQEIEKMLKKAGFTNISKKSLSGGIATILFAKKDF